MKSTDPVTILNGVGPALAEQLAQRGIHTIRDLALFLPRKYDDYSTIVTLSAVRPGLVSVRVRFENIKTSRVRRGLHITTAEAVDETARLRVTWFNQPYRAAALKPGVDYFVRGEYGLSGNRLQLTNPSVELADTVGLLGGGIVPTYREKGKLTSRVYQRLLVQLGSYFNHLPDPLPAWMTDQYGLMPYGQALKQMHMPESAASLEGARARLAFEELLVVMLAVQLNRVEVESAKALPIPFDADVARAFVAHLPFDLTESQRTVVWQIYNDMEREQPMNRLVEGDVGSGKTVVAAMAAVMALHAGRQVAFLAPTELLARQHADTLMQLLAHTDFAAQLALLVGGVKSKAKSELKKRIASHDVQFVVGTHALLQEDIDWHDLGLVIVDEQHRFGVQQRQTLHTKAGHMPHVLCMTATPIPRSLALTVYGELDISIIQKAPAVRAGVDTEIVSPNSRAQMYASIDAELQEGRQAFVVCPLIEENDLIQAISAESMYDTLRKGVFKHRRIGLLHGRMQSSEKEAVMRQFVDHELDILVSTTVIEVGVDVPNASVMVIEGADRFGLAQAHQLRGRVGRGIHKGHCFLVMSDSKAPTRRMRALQSTSDGFRLAELDLEIRGPGAIYGTRQHGALDLQIASLSDTQNIVRARSAAREFFDRGEELIHYSQLAAAVQRAVNLTYLN